MREQRRRRWLAGALVALAVGALSVGIPATLAPHAFYHGYPWLRHWVDRLPPYNEHLTTDVGEFELVFGLLFAFSALRPRRALVVPVCLAWALSQAIHAAYHAAHLRHFPVGDAVAQTVAFVVLVGLALAAAALARATRL